MSAVEGWSRALGIELAAGAGHDPLDLSLGVPPGSPPGPAEFGLARHTDPPGYPLSAGSTEFRRAAADYLRRRFGPAPPENAVAACAGSKEFITTLPTFLRSLGDGTRDIVLVPSLSYRPYRFGAELAGLQVRAVPMGADLRMRLDLIPPDVAARVLLLWVTSPNNPTGVVEPLEDVAAWGREQGVLVCSDEAYAEMTWCHEPRTMLLYGHTGVLTVHSVSKRSNAPGLRIGFYAGDPSLVAALAALRREAGLIAAAASQTFATRLLRDDAFAVRLRTLNRSRIEGLVRVLRENALQCSAPDGGYFAWVAAPGRDGTAFARELAVRAGVVVTPGTEYGPAGATHVRVAAVREPTEIGARLALLPPFVPGGTNHR